MTKTRAAALVAAVALSVTMSSCGTTVHQSSSPAPVVAPAVNQTTNSVWPEDEPAYESDCWDDASCALPGHTITEDSPLWNCLTTGDHSCDEGWQPIDNADATGGRKGCLVRYGDTSFVVCPDGYVSES